MNIQTMRLLDYWIGKPLCFLFSLSNSALKIMTSFDKAKSIPGRILFIKLSELGAIILAYPLLKQVKEQYPSAELFFVTFKKNKGIFKLAGGIISDKNILVINDDSLWSFIMDTLRVFIKLRQEKTDIVFDLEFFSRFSSILTYLSGAKKKVGFYRYTFEGLYRGNLLTHKVLYNPLSHIVKNYLSLGQVIKERNKNSPELDEKINDSDIIFPKYVTDNKIREKIQSKLRNIGLINGGRIFLLNPGEGVLPLREWPLDNFTTLASKILKEENNYIIIVGTEGANAKAKSVQKALGNPGCIDLVGHTTLEELMELFSLSDALISNDCGLAHLAMLTSIKKFIIFGPESPRIFGPLNDNNWIIYSNWPCSPCLSVLNHRNSACKDTKCLKSIKPEEVYRLIKEAL